MRKCVFHIVQQAMMGIINVESSCQLKTCESLQNIRKKLHSVIKTFSKMSNYCAQIRRQTQQAFFVCVAILILQLESEDAILQPTFAPRFPRQTVSASRCKTFCGQRWITPSHTGRQRIKKTTMYALKMVFPWPCCAFKSLFPRFGPVPAS